MLEGEEIEIEYINYAYDVEEFVASSSKLNLLNKQKATVKRWQKQQREKLKLTKEQVKADPLLLPPFPREGCCSKVVLDLKKIEEDITVEEEKIKQIEEQLDDNTKSKYYIGTAFIVFSTSKQQSKIVLHQDDSILRYLYNTIKASCCKGQASAFMFERAPEPSDIYWENLKTSFLAQTAKITLTYLLTTIVICFCFVCNYLINIYG